MCNLLDNEGNYILNIMFGDDSVSHFGTHIIQGADASDFVTVMGTLNNGDQNDIFVAQLNVQYQYLNKFVRTNGTTYFSADGIVDLGKPHTYTVHTHTLAGMRAYSTHVHIHI